MSTDQQWAGGGGGGYGARGMQHEQMHERRIPVHDRFVPFLAPFLMTLLVVPAVETISWAVGLIPSARPYVALILICWVVLGFVLGGIAMIIGKLITKRVPWVYQHVAITTTFWGLASAITTAYGWSWPWGIFHAFGSLLFASSWVLYRIDSLRSAANQGGAKDYWGEVIGLRTSRPRNITVTPTHIEFEVEHGPGETRETVRSAAKKMESALDAVEGRTSVTAKEGGQRSGTSVVRFAMADVFAEGNWQNWPGPSHPGGTFAYPLRTGYYETGEPEWFSFAASVRSPLTDFVSPMDTFLGAVGTTGSGKSGDISNMVAEALSRCDVVVCWIDKAKIEQNAAWCLDMLAMAGNAGSAKHLTKALRKLAEYRVRVFGQVALDAVFDDNATEDIGRSWTPELAQETGEAAVLAVVDEADIAIQNADWGWLSARGRSLGIFLYAATPRASAAEVPAMVRGSIATWKTYSIGDNYSGMFSISDETLDAGANPSALRAQGLHYLDRAPGISLRLYATLARAYHSTGKQLRRDVLKYRGVTFEPMGFSRGAIEAMGDDYRQCDPRRLTERGWNPDAEPADDTVPDAPSVPASPTPLGNNLIRQLMQARLGGLVDATEEEIAEARRILQHNGELPPADTTPGEVPDDDEEEDDEMTRATYSPDGVDEDAGESHAIDPRSQMTDEEFREFEQIDPGVPQPVTQSGEIRLTRRNGKPVWEPDAVERELDRVLVLFARAGKRRFTNGDVLETMRCYFDPATCSRRLHALCNGGRTAPGGLTVEPQGRGTYELVGDLDETYNPARETES
jgi:hypothetical protein